MDITELLNAVDNSTSDWEIDEDEADLAVEGLDEEEEEVDSGEEAQPAPALNDKSQPGPTPARRTGNEYVDNLVQDSGLQIVREREVMLAFRQRQELGLFSLFFTRDFRGSLRIWTNEKLRDLTTSVEMDAFLGLEIATSISPFTELAEVWSTSPS